MRNTRLRASWVAALTANAAALLLTACAPAGTAGKGDAADPVPRDSGVTNADTGPSLGDFSVPVADASSGDARPVGDGGPGDGRASLGDGGESADARASADGSPKTDGAPGPDARVNADARADTDAKLMPDAAPAGDAAAVPGGLCDHATDLNAAVAGAGFADGDTRGTPALAVGSCGGAAGGEVVYTWRVGPDLAPVTFATDFPETASPTVVYVRAACEGADDLGCNRGSPAEPGTRLRFVPPAPGVYYVIVDTGARDGGGPFRLTAAADPVPACSDGRDNDGDMLIDLVDPGCADGMDDMEADPAVPALCSDGLDNDADGFTDYPADPDCLAAGDDGERADSCGGGDPVCGGANLALTYTDNSQTGGPWIAFRYRPDVDKTLYRLEVFTGEIVGPNVISLYASDPATDAPSQMLSTGDWIQVQQNSWQGADLAAPVDVIGGLDYWVVWQPVAGSQSPFDDVGESVDYRATLDNGLSWIGPFQAACKFRTICCRP